MVLGIWYYNEIFVYIGVRVKNEMYRDFHCDNKNLLNSGECEYESGSTRYSECEII